VDGRCFVCPPLSTCAGGVEWRQRLGPRWETASELAVNPEWAVAGSGGLGTPFPKSLPVSRAVPAAGSRAASGSGKSLCI